MRTRGGDGALHAQEGPALPTPGAQVPGLRRLLQQLELTDTRTRAGFPEMDGHTQPR